MRITADTNFLVSATQWDNSVAHKLLIELIETNAEIFMTKEILECAVTSKSEYILTYDNHLLNLKEFREIKIVKPEC